MMKRQETWALRAAGSLVAVLLSAGLTGCVETALYERAALNLDGARRDNGLKDQQIRALQWQLASAGQHHQVLTQKDAVALAELDRRMQEASAANRALAERLKAREKEIEKLTLALAHAEEEAAAKRGPQGPTVRLRPEELKRLEAAVSARDAEVSELIARVEKLLAERAAAAASPGERPPRGIETDVVDPWNGGRK